MAFRHGIYSRENTTSMIAPVTANASLNVVFGTAPVNLTENPLVNEPVLCFNYSEAVQKLGYSDNFDDYTLCEAMYSQFSLFGVSPVVFVNVLDPAKHKKEIDEKSIVFVEGKATIKETGILKETLVFLELKDSDGEAIVSSEAEVAFNDKGHLNVFAEGAAQASVKYSALDPSLVNDDDIVGGVDMNGNYSGLELVSQVFPLFRLVPGAIVCPKFSTSSLVAAVMEAKSQHINGVFSAISIPDISTKEASDYTKVAKIKNDNNITSTYQFATWPKVKLGDKEMHLSTQLASLMSQIDLENEGVPYITPSNKNLKMDGAILEDGTPVILGVDQANYLNGEGIVTTVNFIGGHKLWGNRTAVYPANSDAKDSFIPLRRMFNYVANTLVLTYWNKIDEPGRPKLVETILRSVNTWLDGLTSEGKLLGGRVEFSEELNPTTALLDGKFQFSVYLTPPTPAEEINFILELDVAYFETLFAA